MSCQGSKISKERLEVLKITYDEICRAHDGIAEFRAKLLALLPIASGAGIFLLLKLETNSLEYLTAIGTFGGLVTLGLYLYELRGIHKCNVLTACGQKIEKELLGCPKGKGAFTDDPPAAYNFVGSTWAARIIYPTVIGAWSYVALVNNMCSDPKRLLISGVITLFFIIFEWALVSDKLKSK